MKQETINRIVNFTKERNWEQFHSPCNLTKSIVIEAGELLECFQWSDTNFDIDKVKDELADVFIYAYDLLLKLNLNIDEIVNHKMEKNELKYPINKFKNSSKKYTEVK